VYLSKEQARDELARLVGTDLLVGYDSLNPLPRSFVLNFEPTYLNLADIAGVENEIADFPGTAEVAYSRVWLQKAEETKAVILQLGLGLGVLILLTALISSANNIRLMTRARATGFRQMLLLGASRTFIGLPLIIEGFLLGAVSASLGWWVVYYGHSRVSFAQIEIILPQPEEMALFCLAAAVLGALSGYVGVRGALKGWR
jgi:cell division protein FtsX